jgi:transposase-like protein
MNATVKNSKMARRYGEEFKRHAVELMIHGGKTQRQVARELDVSDYSLNLWKKAYLSQQKPAEINGEIKSPEEMAKIIREQHKEIEYLKRQREILKKR